MQTKQPDEILPPQEKGAESNTEESKSFNTMQEAHSFFERLKKRLCDISEWQHYAGALTASFKLCDENGDEVNRAPQEGDHFKIDIPGPGPVTGDGFDWVQIQKVEEENTEQEESLSIIVHPATNPNNNRQDIAHFFSEEATSCFMAKRVGTTVTMGVYGRNETPNVDAEKVIDKARNTAVAGGAIATFSKIQWRSLVTGLMKIE